MVDERTAYWGARDAARYRTRDDDPTGGDYVVAETLDANGDPVDVLLRWDDTAGEWVSGGPVNMSGADVTNVGALDADSVSTGKLGGVRVARDESDIGAAISQAATDGASLFVPPSRSESFMTLSSPVSVTPPNNWTLEIHPNAPEIDASGLADGTVAIDISGSEDGSASVTADVSEGDTTLSVTDESVVSAGEYALLESDDSFDPSRAAYTKGEIVRVASTSAGQVTLDEGTFDSYTSANGAKITGLTTPEGVTIRNAEIRGKAATTGGQAGLDCRYLLNATIDECEVAETADRGITLNNCIHTTAKDCRAVDCADSVTGYGIQFTGASQWCEIVDSEGVRCRHATEVSGGGVSRFCTFENPTAEDCSQAGISSHGGGENITWVNPTATRNDSGILIRCRNSTVIGGTAESNGLHGLATDEGGPIGLTVDGLVSQNNDGRGAHIFSADVSHRDVTIDMTARRNGQQGLNLPEPVDGLRVRGHYIGNTNSGVRVADASDFDIDITARDAVNNAGLRMDSSAGGNTNGRVSGTYTNNADQGITRQDSGYDAVIFDSIIARGSTTNFDVTAQTNDVIGDVLS